MITAKRRLHYTDADRERFTGFFEKKQKKRRVGRPKKKKRRYNKKKKKKNKQTVQQTLSGEKKPTKSNVRRQLFEDEIDGEAIKQKQRGPKKTHTNWDKEPNLSYRARLATSWMTRTDKWQPNESFFRFCKRNGIDRNVLLNYMQKIKDAGPNRKPGGKRRGRKPTLPPTVMHHLCEGLFCKIIMCNKKVQQIVMSLQFSPRHHIAFCSCAETRRKFRGTST